LPKALLQVRAPAIASRRSMYLRRPTPYEHQLWLKQCPGLNDVGQIASGRLDKNGWKPLPYKVPRHITFIEALPKSAVGKILRKELRPQSSAAIG
jgi:acyl-CoA synthetase (AMP-forming)/AMP-acid ligase II